ncbi:hypothetical protein HZC53_04490 [Candidatus Uhrbacteria bacterium]|nr:hypothetical protein [Candidatus Uhrbacteria bacterium]
MRKHVVYTLVAVVGILWSAVCISLLGHFKADPPVFFEIILIWLGSSFMLGRLAKRFVSESPVFGQFQSKIDSWNRLQRTMREEEKMRRSYRP